MTHDEYIAKIKELQSRVDDLPVTELELTAEERAALDSATDEQLALLNASLAAFEPMNPDYDFRRIKAEKGLALYILEVLPVIEQAYRMGHESV